MKPKLAAEVQGVLAFLAAIWIAFAVASVLPSLNDYGVKPRTLSGLVGIPAMPFLHANLQHVVSNTVPLFVLLMLLASSKARLWEIVAAIVLLGGALLWLFGRFANHIGASGLIFGMIGFLIVSGLVEKRLIPLAISVAVGILYGGTLLSGVVPKLGSHVSWDGHLCGAIAGGIVAYVFDKSTARDEPIPDET